MGQSVGHYRRKPLTDCYVGEHDLKTPVVSPCECTAIDYECDVNYTPSPEDATKCVQSGPLNDQPLECKVGNKYKGKSGYRKIPGNKCQGGDDKKDQPIEKECQELPPGPAVPPKGLKNWSPFLEV